MEREGTKTFNSFLLFFANPRFKIWGKKKLKKVKKRVFQMHWLKVFFALNGKKVEKQKKVKKS